MPMTRQRLSAVRTAVACSTSVGGTSMSSSNIPVVAAGTEQDSRVWIERLAATGPDRDAAIADLHALWAYKFALYEAAAKVRKRAWQGRDRAALDARDLSLEGHQERTP
jgi:hypothetical protein